MPKSNLKHVGVLGMKWGRRRGESSADHKSALGGLKGKQAHELSNEQIRKATDRINLERNYKALTAKPSNPAIKAIKEALANQGKTLLITAVASSSALAVKYAMEHRTQILDAAANLVKIIPKSG